MHTHSDCETLIIKGGTVVFQSHVYTPVQFSGLDGQAVIANFFADAATWFTDLTGQLICVAEAVDMVLDEHDVN